MRFNRKDYQGRIIDTAGGIPEDEPVFLLRGKDITAPDTVRFWAREAAKAGADPEMVGAALHQADEMSRWQFHNGGKRPDLPEEGT